MNEQSAWRVELARRYIEPYRANPAVERTLELVEEHLPEVDTSRARSIWSLPAQPCEAAPW